MEQTAGLLRQFEKTNTFVQIGLDCVLVPADRLQAPLLLGTPFRCLAIEEVGVNASVQLVDIHRDDAVLKPVVLSLNSADGIFVMLFLVIVTELRD